MSPSSCFTALASSSSSRDGMAGLPARRRRAATLFGLCRRARFVLNPARRAPSTLVEGWQASPSEPSVYHSRGSHAPPNPSSFPRQLPALFHSREGGASARREGARSAARAKMEKELDEEAPQAEEDVRRSAPVSPAPARYVQGAASIAPRHRHPYAASPFPTKIPHTDAEKARHGPPAQRREPRRHGARARVPVSYTHLTLPTILLV